MKIKFFITFGFDRRLVGFCHCGLCCVDSIPSSGFAHKIYSYSINSMDVENDFVIWHIRLGHIGLR